MVLDWPSETVLAEEKVERRRIYYNRNLNIHSRIVPYPCRAWGLYFITALSGRVAG